VNEKELPENLEKLKTELFLRQILLNQVEIMSAMCHLNIPPTQEEKLQEKAYSTLELINIVD